MKDNNKQRIKAGDYVAVRDKKWNDKTQWDAWTRITRVLSVKNGEVTHTRYDRVWTSDICNCVKVSKEEVEKYCEMKGSRDMVDGLGDEIEKWISESSEKIKVGDKIGTNYEDKGRGGRRHYEKYDYVVLGESKDLIVCTRPNKNRDIYIFPRCNCYIKGDDAAETEPEEDEPYSIDLEDEPCEIDLEDEPCEIDLEDEPYEIDLGDDDYYPEA